MGSGPCRGRRAAAVAVATPCRDVVFAGGDPSRAAISGSVPPARPRPAQRGPHHRPSCAARIRHALSAADCVASLWTDRPPKPRPFLNKQGNFAKVFELLGFLDHVHVPGDRPPVVAQPTSARWPTSGPAPALRHRTFGTCSRFAPGGPAMPLSHRTTWSGPLRLGGRERRSLERADVHPPVEDKAVAYVISHRTAGPSYGNRWPPVDWKVSAVGSFPLRPPGRGWPADDFRRECRASLNETTGNLQERREVLARGLRQLTKVHDDDTCSRQSESMVTSMSRSGAATSRSPRSLRLVYCRTSACR